MLNQCILVGVVAKVKEKDGKKEVTLEINNPDGTVEVLPITIRSNMTHAMEYVKEGTTLGVKASIRNGAKLIILAEKLTFINTNNDE